VKRSHGQSICKSYQLYAQLAFFLALSFGQQFAAFGSLSSRMEVADFSLRMQVLTLAR